MDPFINLMYSFFLFIKHRQKGQKEAGMFDWRIEGGLPARLMRRPKTLKTQCFQSGGMFLSIL